MADGGGGRSDQAPISAANRTFETLPPELAAQEAEIERLTADNHRLGSTNAALEHDLVASQQDIQRLRAHVTSTKTEAYIQIQGMLEKIAKMEAARSAGESIKEDLQQAHIKAQGLLKTNQDLSGQIQQAQQELEIARADIKRLPEMQSELESLIKEHQRLRKIFEYEKGWNMEKVEKLKVMEMDLVRLSEAREYLRTQVAHASRRAMVPNPHDAPSMNQDPLHPQPPHIPNAGGYDDNSSRSMQTSLAVSGEIIVPSGVDNATATGNNGGAAFPG